MKLGILLLLKSILINITLLKLGHTKFWCVTKVAPKLTKHYSDELIYTNLVILAFNFIIATHHQTPESWGCCSTRGTPLEV